MTAEQQKDDERRDRYIIREGLASVMNDTKWREVIAILKDVCCGSVKFQVKCIRDKEPPADHWDGSFPYHVPGPYKTIEWLKVRVPNTEDLIIALTRASIPFDRIGDTIQLKGYTRFS